MTPDPSERRRYRRIRTYKGVRVSWKVSGQIKTARVQNVGLGGLFLQTANPAAEGTSIEIILALPTGQVCARAMVRRCLPGKGMGVQFVQMSPDDRTKLNRYIAEGEALETAPVAARATSASPAEAVPAGCQIVLSPRREEMARLRFEREARELAELTGRSNYYQILGVTSDFTGEQIKKSFHALARKFHPDNHAGVSGSALPLKELMAIISEAYRTLVDEEKRAAYDKYLLEMGGLSLHRAKPSREESVEGWLARANQYLRAKNYAGSVVWLRKCVAAVPEHALYRGMLARSLATIPQCREEAIEHFQKAIDVDPWEEQLYLQFAELFEEMRLFSRARGVYSKLLEISPGNAKAGERLAALESGANGEKAPVLTSSQFFRKS